MKQEDKATITLENVTTGYRTSHGDVVIQRDITSCLRAGEFTCLLGPNGAGKSTLLRTLAGFLPPLSGCVKIAGDNLANIARESLSKRVGVVLTERPSVSSMTVEQLVALGRSPYTGFWGRLTNDDRNVVREAMQLTNTESLAGRLVDTLSDGERQKVMIAKALAQQTPIIFLDEPTAFLDYPSKADTMRLLRDLAHDKQKTIFLSTHDLNMALALADTLWLVDRQLGVGIGTPSELAESGTLQSYFESPGLIFDSVNLLFSVK